MLMAPTGGMIVNEINTNSGMNHLWGGESEDR